MITVHILAMVFARSNSTWNSSRNLVNFSAKADYEVANTGWEKYRAASDEILQLSREGKQQEAAKLMTGEVYEEYKAFAEELTTLRDEFQAELDRAKTMANVCTVIIFIVIVAAGLAVYPHGLTAKFHPKKPCIFPILCLLLHNQLVLFEHHCLQS